MTIHSFDEQPLAELTAALVKFQNEVGAIPKTSSNPFFKSKYAGLPAVVETAGPILAKHGLAVSQHIGYDLDNDTLETWLLHTSGQYLVSRMRLLLTKQDSQGQGSAITYARRYAFMSVLGLVADDDDDGNAASQRSSSPASKSAPAKAGKVSEAQGKALFAITKKLGLELGAASQERWAKNPRELSTQEASAWIDELQTAQDALGTEPF